MKIILHEDDECEDVQIHIHCKKMDARLQNIVSYMKQCSSIIIGEKNGAHVQLMAMDILYFMSMKDVTYAYTKDDCYRLETKLYVLEEKVKPLPFIRISKSCLANIQYFVHVKPLFDGKFEAFMENHEILVINRHYVKAFKEAFGL